MFSSALIGFLRLRKPTVKRRTKTQNRKKRRFILFIFGKVAMRVIWAGWHLLLGQFCFTIRWFVVILCQVWLNDIFLCSLQKKFEQAFKNSLEVIRKHQQQGNLKFLSHFKSKFVIHRGHRKEPVDRSRIAPAKLYQLRVNDSLVCSRCIEVRVYLFFAY